METVIIFILALVGFIIFIGLYYVLWRGRLQKTLSKIHYIVSASLGFAASQTRQTNPVQNGAASQKEQNQKEQNQLGMDIHELNNNVKYYLISFIPDDKFKLLEILFRKPINWGEVDKHVGLSWLGISKGGSIDAFEWLNVNRPGAINMNIIIEHHNNELFKKFYLDWFGPRGLNPEVEKSYISHIVLYGNLPALEIVYKNARNKGYKMDMFVDQMAYAVRLGHLHIGEWLFEKILNHYRNNMFFRGNQLHKEWIRHTYRIMDLAVTLDNKNLIKWVLGKQIDHDYAFYTNKERVEQFEFIVKNAARRGSLKVTQWFFEKPRDSYVNRPFNEWNRYIYHREVTNEMNRYIYIAMIYAVTYGRLNIVEWVYNLHPKNYTIPDEFYDIAIYENHNHILNFFLDKSELKDKIKS